MTTKTRKNKGDGKRSRGGKDNKGNNDKNDPKKRLAAKPGTGPIVKLREYRTVVELSPEEKRDMIAEWSDLILQDPQRNAFSSTGTLENGMKIPCRMRRLLEMATYDKNGQDANTAQLAMLSILSLFGDIIPSYRIRLPTEAELMAKVSKETKKTRDYERELLTHYQSYLKLLSMTWADYFKTNPSLAVAALLCVCQLFQKVPHFNQRSTLLTLVTKNALHHVTEVSESCCDALSHVCTHDAQGEISLEVARKLAKLLKDRHYRCHPRVLRVFLSLPLRVHVDEAQAAKLAAQANQKKRKRNKEEAAIEDELRESSGRVDKILLARSQSDTLQTIVLVYFRVLKSVSGEGLDSTQNGLYGNKQQEEKRELLVRDALSPALEGLAKFAHLINLETVMDLLDVLKSLLQRVELLPLDAALNCVMTAFQTLQGPGRELKIDQKEYIAPLYAQLNRLCTESAARDHTDLLIRCLHVALLKRREFSTARLGAFLKQICTVAMHVPPHASAALLVVARELLQRYKATLEPMLENEQDVITSGQYGPFRKRNRKIDGVSDNKNNNNNNKRTQRNRKKKRRNGKNGQGAEETIDRDADNNNDDDDTEEDTDPDLANPFATSAWELATLQFHIHDAVASQAAAAANEKMLQLPAETPEQVREGLLKDEEEVYITCKRHKKQHPLEKSKAKKSGSQRQQERFITPRPTKNYHLL